MMNTPITAIDSILIEMATLQTKLTTPSTYACYPPGESHELYQEIEYNLEMLHYEYDLSFEANIFNN